MSLEGSGALKPFVGLRPFEASDAPLFFGRERDVRLVLASLKSNNLTVLHGNSGVGKTSLLRAGILPALGEGVVFFADWHGSPLRGLKQNLEDLLEQESPQSKTSLQPDAAMEEIAVICSRGRERPILLVIDQFETFLLRQPDDEGRAFEREIVRIINSTRANVNVLFSVREDAVVKLDRFQTRIPDLFGNLIRLGHLDREQAVAAIRGPLHAVGAKIEDELIEVLLKELEAPRDAWSAPRGDPSDQRIELSVLQAVMARLWEAEAEQSRTIERYLKIDTFRRLGGVARIVGDYVGQALRQLRPSEAVLANQILGMLVTPSGSRIAHSLEDLAAYCARPVDAVDRLLSELSERRILRAWSDDKGQRRIQVAHDQLVPGILEWRAKIVARKRTANAIYTTATFAAILALSLAVAISLYSERRKSDQLIQELDRCQGFVKSRLKP